MCVHKEDVTEIKICVFIWILEENYLALFKVWDLLCLSYHSASSSASFVGLTHYFPLLLT